MDNIQNINQLDELYLKFSDYLYRLEIKEAFKALGEISILLEEKYINSQNGYSDKEIINKNLIENFNLIIKFIDNKDYILAADTVRYEIIPILNQES